MDNFKWTDELVLRYVRSVMTSDHPYFYNLKHWKQFIQDKEASKQSSKDGKDYEIISYKIPGNEHWEVRKIANGTWNNWSEIHKEVEVAKGNWKIKSVLRLPDNEVFSVGDEVVWNISENCKQSFKITSFEINGVGRVFCNNKNISIKYIEKVKQPIPLFTTEDGKEIFQGGECWILENDKSVFKWEQCCKEGMQDNYKYFTTKDAAKKYILFNRPILSLNDLLEVWDFGAGEKPEFYKQAPMFKKFQKVAENKINKQ